LAASGAASFLGRSARLEHVSSWLASQTAVASPTHRRVFRSFGLCEVDYRSQDLPPKQGAVLACGNFKVIALLQIFSELAKIGPVVEGEQEEPSSRSPWCNTEPHPGLRAYPFLSQVRGTLHAELLTACRQPGGAQQSIEDVLQTLQSAWVQHRKLQGGLLPSVGREWLHHSRQQQVGAAQRKGQNSREAKMQPLWSLLAVLKGLKHYALAAILTSAQHCRCASGGRAS
jgi:hypothetical protein